MLRKFIESRVKPFVSGKVQVKDLVNMFSMIYNHSATNLLVTKEMLQEQRFVKDLQVLLNGFVDKFPKSKSQL
jgi:hypothetical protein